MLCIANGDIAELLILPTANCLPYIFFLAHFYGLSHSSIITSNTKILRLGLRPAQNDDTERGLFPENENHTPVTLSYSSFRHPELFEGSLCFLY